MLRSPLIWAGTGLSLALNARKLAQERGSMHRRQKSGLRASMETVFQLLLDKVVG